MHAPIMVNYVPDGGDWTVTVTDEEQTQNATASGLIAARDQADQIVEKMVPNQTGRTVVHLLEGDAVAFTNTYLQVRLGFAPVADPAAGPPQETPEAEPPADSTPAAPAAADLSAPDGTVPSQPTPDTTAAPTAATTQPSESAPTAEAPSADVAAPQAEVPTIAPAQPDEADKNDQLTEVAGSPSNQVN